MYLKITNKSELHNNLQYHDGLVEDIVPFQPEGSCVPGGIYFTTPEYICGFICYGVWVREVTIPNRARMVQDPEGDKWRANKVILSPRRDLREVETWKWLVENGVNIHAHHDFALRRSAKNGYLEVVQYLIKNGAKIHTWDDEALRVAALNGHLEIVKYLVEHGADIHTCDDEAFRNAAYNGHLKIVKYLALQYIDIIIKKIVFICFG